MLEIPQTIKSILSKVEGQEQLLSNRTEPKLSKLLFWACYSIALLDHQNGVYSSKRRLRNTTKDVAQNGAKFWTVKGQ